MTTPIVLDDYPMDDPEREPKGRPIVLDDYPMDEETSPAQGKPIIMEGYLVPEPQQEKPLSTAFPTAESIHPPLPGKTGGAASPPPVEPSVMDRIGNVAGSVVEHFTPESPMELVTGALDALGWAFQPVDQFSEGIVRGLTGQPQGTYSERVEGFSDRPWWQQLAIGAVTDPTAAIGAAGRGARAVTQVVPDVARSVGQASPSGNTAEDIVAAAAKTVGRPDASVIGKFAVAKTRQRPDLLTYNIVDQAGGEWMIGVVPDYTESGPDLTGTILSLAGRRITDPEGTPKFSPGEVRELLRDIAQEFPDAKSVGGMRVTAGHREAEQTFDLTRYRGAMEPPSTGYGEALPEILPDVSPALPGIEDILPASRGVLPEIEDVAEEVPEILPSGSRALPEIEDVSPLIGDVESPTRGLPEIEDALPEIEDIAESPLELARRELDEAQAHFEGISVRGTPVPRFGTPEGSRSMPLRQMRAEAGQRLNQAREQLHIEENSFAEAQMRAADISDSLPEATRLFARGPQLTDFRIADEPLSLKPTGEIIEGGLQEILGQFRQVLNDPQRAEEWRQALLLRGQERGRRSANMRDRANVLVSEGVSTEEAINIATRELAGELPSPQTPLHALATPYVREALFQEVYTKLADEPLEMRSTATALANALAGHPIPRTPGIKGGSAFARLQRVFGEDVTRAITQRRSLEEIIAFETREGLGLTRPTGPRVPFLEQPSTQTFGTARQIGPQQTFGQLPTERLLGEEPLFAPPQQPLMLEPPPGAFPGRPPDLRSEFQRSIDLQRFREALGEAAPPIGPSLRIPFPEEVALQQPARPLMPEPPAEPFAPRKADLRPQAQKEIDLQMFREAVGGGQPPRGIDPEIRAVFGDLPPDKIIKQGTLYPEETRERMLRYAKNAGLTVMDLGNLMRANIATVDLSYLRQQVFLIPGNVVPFAKSFKDALKSVVSEDYARGIDHWIKSDPDYRYYEALDIDFLRALDSKAAKDWQKAEDFIVMGGNRPLQKLAEKLPWINISGRAYVTGMNSMNWHIFKGHMRMLHRMNEEIGAGRMVLPPGKVLDINDSAKRFGAHLADMSGRGPLHGRMFGHDVDIRSTAPILNNIFFSTRLNLGRMLTPRHLWSSDKYTRQAAWKNMLTGAGTVGGLVYGGSLMGWWDAEMDPRSSNWGKVRVGPITIDPWGGFQQFGVLAWRLANSFREDNLKSASTGELSYRQPQDLVAQFGRSKLAPGISQTLMAFTGRDFRGKEIDRRDWRMWLGQNMSLALHDVYEAYEAEGFLGAGLGATALLGGGVTVFEEEEEEKGGTSTGTRPRTPWYNR